MLEEVAKIVKARGKEYGKPDAHWAATAEMWSVFLGVQVRTDQVPVLFMLDKIVRMKTSPGHRDSLKDIAGYADGAFGLGAPTFEKLPERNGAFIQNTDEFVADPDCCVIYRKEQHEWNDEGC